MKKTVEIKKVLKKNGLTEWKKGKSARIKGMSIGYGDFWTTYDEYDNVNIISIKASKLEKLNKIIATELTGINIRIREM